MIRFLAVSLIFLSSCTTEVQTVLPDEYVERPPATVHNLPDAASADVSAHDLEEIQHGKYLVELLGCGACHTNGAIVGEPDFARALSGSEIGIAVTTPLQTEHPAIVFAPNITPDVATGIGTWSDDQIVEALRRGKGRHGQSLSLVMPWPGFAKLSEEDAYAIARYLKHIEPVRNQVPANVPRGKKTNARHVYFGIYEKR